MWRNSLASSCTQPLRIGSHTWVLRARLPLCRVTKWIRSWNPLQKRYGCRDMGILALEVGGCWILLDAILVDMITDFKDTIKLLNMSRMWLVLSPFVERCINRRSKSPDPISGRQCGPSAFLNRGELSGSFRVGTVQLTKFPLTMTAALDASMDQARGLGAAAFATATH